MDIIVKITGLDELIRKVNDPALLGEPIRGFFNVSTMSIQRDTMQLTPVDTGRLRASITTSIDPSPVPLYGLVGTNVFYGPYIEYGTRPHRPPIAVLMRWAKAHGVNVYALARTIAIRGTRAHYMFQKSVQSNLINLEGFLKEAAAEIEDRWRSK
jgi:phage gpG-like protein